MYSALYDGYDIFKIKFLLKYTYIFEKYTNMENKFNIL